MNAFFLALGGSFALLLALDAPVRAHPGENPDTDLGRTIHGAMEAEGPWLLPAERALIERKCGYAPGSRDGDSITINDGVLVCANGRRVDDPEVRTMLATASPRIARRVRAVMDSPAIRNAISAVSDRAVRRALERSRVDRPRRDRSR
jgi:hypothetical protein